MKLSPAELARVEGYLNERRGDMVDTLCRLVSIPSVSRDDPDPAHPFGPGCRAALDEMQKICAEKGLVMVNHENYCGSVRYGDGEEELGVFSHLDVVPAGTGWTGDPFLPVVENGFVRGRGAIDNKAGAVVGLYAVECLRALGIRLRHAVRLFYGCSEEGMMNDVLYYGEKVGWPKFSLIPDAVFPAAFAEKGICAGYLTSGPVAREIRSLRAGTVTNAVAGDCVLTLAPEHFAAVHACRTERVRVTFENNETVVRAFGLAAHASRPQQSVNAIALAFDVLLAAGILRGEERGLISFWARCLHDFYGGELGIALDRGEYGELTIIGGTASLEDGCFRFGFNCRYPAGDSCERIVPRLDAVCGAHGLSLAVEEGVDGFCMSPDHPLVTALTALANELTGEQRVPYLMNGATYCRDIPNSIPFGPEMDQDAPAFPVGKGGIHQADESMSIDELVRAVKIYVAALVALDALIQ